MSAFLLWYTGQLICNEVNNKNSCLKELCYKIIKKFVSYNFRMNVKMA